MENPQSQKEKNQRITIIILSAVVIVLVIVIVVMAILYRPVVINTNTTQSKVTTQTATSTSTAAANLQLFVNTKYGYELLYPAPMTVTDGQLGGDPSKSGLVSFNGQAVNIPSFTVSASTNTAQSNNNGTLVCSNFINGKYTSFPVHSLIFYYGNVSTQNGSVLSFCTIHQGIKYTIASVGPRTTNNESLLRGAVGSFSLVK